MLDLESVHAFVLVSDFLSFTRAGEAMNLPQSAVSLKIKRLEEQLGRRLLERTPRQVSVTIEGRVFLDFARSLLSSHQAAVNAFDDRSQLRLRVGVSLHIVGQELPKLLEKMYLRNPSVLLELSVASSIYVFQSFESGELDAALVLELDNRRQAGKAVLKEEFVWMGSPTYKHIPGTPLRLASEPRPCGVRAMAIDQLDKHGIPWVEVFIGGGITTIGAAVSAGFAIAALGTRVAPAGAIDIGRRLGLPPLPKRDVLLYSNSTDKVAQGYLTEFVATLKATSSSSG